VTSEGRIRPDQLRRLLLMIRPARTTIAEVPLADLSLGPPHLAAISAQPSRKGYEIEMG
jgi:hypothetical protein